MPIHSVTDRCHHCRALGEPSEYACVRCGDEADLFVCYRPRYRCDDAFPVCNACVEYIEVYECARCGRLEADDDFFVYINDEVYCEDCYNAMATHCDSCRRYIYPDETSYAYGDYIICEDCFIEREDLHCLHPYNYKPELPPVRRYRSDISFGFEIEVEVNDSHDRHEVVEIIYRLSDIVYCKRDGSLDADTGIEIVTHPASKRILTKRLYNLIKYLNDVATSHDNGRCGFHVHVEKSACDAVVVAKLFRLIGTDWLLRLTRRSSSSFERWCSQWSKEEIRSARPIERYRAVNNLPRHTVEFRLFRGTLYYLSLIASIQFVEAVIEFSHLYRSFINLRYETADGEEDASTFHHFINFISTSRFQHLRRYLEERGIIRCA